MHIRPYLTIALILVLASCSGAPSALYLIDAQATTVKSRVSAGTIMVRNVSLPTYAAAEEISRQDADGAVRDTKDGRWADEPARAVTLALSRNLDEMTSATVASEPWPLDGLPDATLEIRVERMIAGNDGQFHLTGQYFYSSDARMVRTVAESFDITVPVAGDGIQSIVAAQSRAISRLAEEIARRI
jgi:uncharacterized lipoprotein YmbA